jgi:hypothetical protein
MIVSDLDYTMVNIISIDMALDDYCGKKSGEVCVFHCR